MFCGITLNFGQLVVGFVCPRCVTALAGDTVEKEPKTGIQSFAYYCRNSFHSGPCFSHSPNFPKHSPLHMEFSMGGVCLEVKFPWVSESWSKDVAFFLYGRVEKPHFCFSRLRGKLCNHISKEGKSAEGWDLTAQPELLDSSLCLQGTIRVQQPKPPQLIPGPFSMCKHKPRSWVIPKGLEKLKSNFESFIGMCLNEFVCQGVVCPVKPRELSGIKRAGIFLVPLLFFFLLKTSP